MIRKIGACLMAFAVAVSFSPSTVEAASSKAQKQKIKKFFKQLKKLPNRAAPVGKVMSLTKKLAKLDTRKANKYFKVATKKFPLEVARQKSGILGSNVSRIVKNSPDLTRGQKNKIVNQIQKEVIRVPTPTPTPYHASILSEAVYA